MQFFDKVLSLIIIFLTNLFPSTAPEEGPASPEIIMWIMALINVYKEYVKAP